MAKTTINIEILKPDDTPEEGYIYFGLAETAALDGVEYSRVPIRVNLDNDGQASIQLQPTDDVDWSVSGLSYLVEERFAGKAPRRFYMTVPTSGSALDYADLATYANAPSIDANIDLAAEWVAWQAAANATYQPLAVAGRDIATFAGVDNTGTNECASAINTALATIAAAGQRAYAKGTFKIGSTVTIAANADLADAVFNYTATSGTAVLVGTSTSATTVQRLRVALPKIVCTSKVIGSGWGSLAGTIGCDISNLYSSFVWVPSIVGFETNLRVYGKGTGCVYNQFSIGHLENGKINLLLDADATGWSNENLYLAGRYSHESAEGTDVAGTGQIKIAVTTNGINNNLFLKPCVEGVVAAYHLEISGGYNRVVQGRYEVSGGARVRWQSNAIANTIDGGYDSGSIVETTVSGAYNNNLLSHTRHSHNRSGGTSGIQVLENRSSSGYPATVIMAAGAKEAGDSPATAFTVHQGATYTRMKRSTDANDRMYFDHSNGRVYFGTGSITPNVYFEGGSGYINAVGDLVWINTNTYDIGRTASRPRSLYLGSNTFIGGYHEVVEQGSDPAAPAANGARLFAKDNGSGKTQLCVRFNSGAVQVIATEP